MKYRIAGRSFNVSMSQCFKIYCTILLYLLFIALYIVVRSQATFHLFIKRDQDRVHRTLPLTLRHYLVNGMVVPTLELEAGKWIRLRISFAGQGEEHAISLQNSSDCEMGVLAKDVEMEIFSTLPNLVRK